MVVECDFTIGPSEQSVMMTPNDVSCCFAYNNSGSVSGVSPRPSFALRYSDMCRKVVSVVDKVPKLENYHPTKFYLYLLP